MAPVESVMVPSVACDCARATDGNSSASASSPSAAIRADLLNDMSPPLWGGIMTHMIELMMALTFAAPPAWHTRPASSNMRVTEFVIPKAPSDTEDAELVLFYFGAGGGGGVEANIDRWIGQVEQPDGSSSKSKAKRAERTINGLKVTTIDVSGTYTAEMRPGA